MSTSRKKWSFLPSIFFVFPALLSIVFLTWKGHYALPEPITYSYDPVTNLPVLSEAAILEHVRQLSEDIGFRTVGTREHALADKWMLDTAHKLQDLCNQVVTREGRHLECEVWRQEGSGSHRFDMMGKRVYKTYKDLSNIVIRVSNGTQEGKLHSVLVNSHLDSSLPSPGAADDALSVGVMIECIRVLVETPHWEPAHAIVFLFNHAEESLQDGSQLFSTQHPVAHTVRAAINLEAAGTTGPALLFQATSKEMIEAYSHVPRPYGTILANDIFSSGFLLSDTDFRQFEYYLNVTGLDMAIVGNSYVYHTRKDIVANIEPGAAQHMADQALALIKHLSSIESPLPNLIDRKAGEKHSVVYFSILGHFFMYSAATAVTLSLSLFFASVSLSIFAVPNINVSSILKGFYATISAFVAAVIAANLVALFMEGVLNKPLSWFSNETAPLFLYGPPALAGALLSQRILPFAKQDQQTLLASVLILHALTASTVQILLKIGSSQLLLVTAISQFLGLLFTYATSSPNHVPLTTYVISQILPLVCGTEAYCAIMDFFVPLTGRIGEEPPAEHIIATIVALVGSYALPTTLPFFARFSARTSTRSMSFLSLITLVMIGLFSLRNPFDAAHPKRVFILHSENVTSGVQHLHVSAADRAPNFDTLVRSIADELVGREMMNTTTARLLPTVMDERNGDWDVLYPFSAFLTPYKLPLLPTPSYVSPWEASSPLDGRFRIEIENEITDPVRRTRKLDLVVHHPGLIWTVIAFDAQVLNWSVDNDPPPEFARHYIREGSFYGVTSYPLSVEIQLPSQGTEKESLSFNFIGIREDAMYPGKIYDAKNVSSGRFENTMATLEYLDIFLDKHAHGAIDALLMGCIGGIVSV